MIHKPNKAISFVLPEDKQAVHSGLFDHIVLSHANAVWQHGQAGAWNEFGVRDPAPLLDEKGYWAVDEKGGRRMFYTGSRMPDGNVQSTGMIISYDRGRSWEAAGKGPVIAPEAGAWDSKVASTPWAIQRDDGTIYLYYRGLSEHLKDESIGVAMSKDGGQTFQKYSGNPILTRRDFAGQPQNGHCCLGVVNVSVTLEGKYLICFEGSNEADNGRAAIFAAISDDGLSFQAINDGKPMFSACDARAWHVNRVANPRVSVFHDLGLYMLSYNGHFGSGRYALGVAFSKDLVQWHDYGGNPVFYPGLDDMDDPFSGRLEGLCFDKAEVEGEQSEITAYLMAIPKRGPSHRKSVIGRSVFVRNPKQIPSFRYQPADDTAKLEYDAGSLSLISPAHSRASRVHLATEKISLVSLSFSFKSLSENGAAYLCLAREPQLLDFDSGLVLRLCKDGLYLSRGNFRIPDCVPLSRTITSYIHRFFPSVHPCWEKICALGADEWQDLEIELSQRLHVRAGGIEYKLPVAAQADYFDIALHVCGASFGVQKMEYR